MSIVERSVGEILQEVRLLVSSRGRGWGAGVGMNDVLAHLEKPLRVFENAVFAPLLQVPPTA
jgi:hypothetical protein